MPRFALKIDYDGAPFHGWQRQSATQPSVQATVEAALAALQPGRHTIACAGRTDAGVHATGQVAHCDLARDWAPHTLMQALNWHLRPAPIAILQAAPVPDSFHARFSAIERRYLFRLIARSAPLTHDRTLVWQVRHPLNLAAMQQAASHLIGHHDFTTFRSALCQAQSPHKTLDEITITEQPSTAGTEYRFTLRARSFLHNQVRSIIGSLERVGTGAWPPDRMGEALRAANRAACGPVCPPQGLYLTGVSYTQNPFA